MRAYVTSLVAVLIVLVGCTSFPTRFERIENMPRVLDFIYTNVNDSTGLVCEAAPGDTMELTACFAGDSIETINWQISYNVVISIYGEDQAYDIQDLPDGFVYSFDTTAFSPYTTAYRMRIPIPRDIFSTSDGFNPDLFGVSDLSRDALVQIVEGLVAVGPATLNSDSVWNALVAPAIGDTAFAHSFKENAAVFMQMMTVYCRVFCTINGVHRVKSDFAVRYNRLLQGFSNIDVNRNPVNRYVCVHKIKSPGPRFYVDDMKETDTTFILYLPGGIRDDNYIHSNYRFTDSIVIDEDYSYFISADTGVYNGEDIRDSAVTFNDSVLSAMLEGQTAGTPEPQKETWNQFFLYQHDRGQCAGMDPSKMLVIFPVGAFFTRGGYLGQMLPPLDTSLTDVHIWTKLSDLLIGEINRSFGSIVQEQQLHFIYTQKYVNSIGEEPSLVGSRNTDSTGLIE